MAAGASTGLGQVQHLVQAACAGEPRHYALARPAQVLERLVEQHDGGEEGDDAFGTQLAVLHGAGRDHDGRGDADRRHQLDGRSEDGPYEEAAAHGAEIAALLGAELLLFVALHPEGLHDADALERLVEQREQGADLFLSAGGDALEAFREAHDGIDGDGYRDEGEEGEAPVERDADAEQHDHLQAVPQVGRETVGDGELDGRHVGGEAREQIARGGPREKGGR